MMLTEGLLTKIVSFISACSDISYVPLQCMKITLM